MMKTTTLMKTAIGLLILIQSCGSSKEANSSSGKSQGRYYSRYLTPVIDGKMNDWGDILSYDNSTKCIYAIANDESTLYICIKAIDRTQQIKIINGGMEIWIDNKVKKNKSIGIKFPLGGGTIPAITNDDANKEPDAMRKQAKSQMLTMELTGFKDGINGSQNVYSSTQVKPVIEWDDKGNLIYELAVPFTALEESVAANLSNISIGIFIKGMKMPEGMDGDRFSEGPPGDGMPSGASAGGMRPPGGGGSGMPDPSQMENMLKENSFWTKYTIAK
jgi:hypothetical protein